MPPSAIRLPERMKSGMAISTNESSPVVIVRKMKLASHTSEGLAIEAEADAASSAVPIGRLRNSPAKKIINTIPVAIYFSSFSLVLLKSSLTYFSAMRRIVSTKPTHIEPYTQYIGTPVLAAFCPVAASLARTP